MSDCEAQLGPAVAADGDQRDAAGAALGLRRRRGARRASRRRGRCRPGTALARRARGRPPAPPARWPGPCPSLAGGRSRQIEPTRPAGRHVDRVPGGRERRRVGEVEVDQLLDAQPARAGRRRACRCAWPTAPRPDDLAAEQPAGAPLGDELHRHRLGVGQVAGDGRARRWWRRRASKPGVGRLPLGEPGARHLERAHLGDRRADDAGEGGVAAAEVDAGHPALLVGDGAEGDVDRPPGHEVVRLAAVARRVHAVERGALAAVDHRARRGAPRSAPASPASSLLGVTPRPSTTRSAPSTPPSASSTLPGSNPATGVLEPDVDRRGRAAGRASRSAMSASSVPMSWSDALDERDLGAPADERLGHLQADVAAARPRRPTGSCDVRAWSRAGLGVVERLHAPHVRRGRCPGRSGRVGPGAGGDVELVERRA